MMDLESRMIALRSESKGAGQVRNYPAADLLVCFRIWKSRFSYDAAHLVELSG